MTSRIVQLFGIFIFAGFIFGGCKSTSTTPTGPTDTTQTNIGNIVPKLHSNYSFIKSQLDQNNTVIVGTTSPGHFAVIDTTGISVHGKSNAYFVLDDGDTCYYSYESNSDVSLFLVNPDYMKNFRDGEQIDGPLQAILNQVFQNWITLPIASKKTLHPYDVQQLTVDINGKFPADIHAMTEFIGDSVIVIKNGSVDDSLAAKHCRLTVTATITFGTVQKTFTHIRDIWFVPRIGYIARLATKTSIPEYTIQLVKLDTTATLTTLQSYNLK